MEPIFDRFGKTVSWLNNTTLHDMRGRAFAFLMNEAVYLYNGQQLGWLSSGFFRDSRGNAVAFMQGCAGGPLPPLPQLAPLPPLPALPPLPPLPPLAPVQPLPTLNWSRLTWDQFVGWE